MSRSNIGADEGQPMLVMLSEFSIPMGQCGNNGSRNSELLFSVNGLVFPMTEIHVFLYFCLLRCYVEKRRREFCFAKHLFGANEIIEINGVVPSWGAQPTAEHEYVYLDKGVDSSACKNSEALLRALGVVPGAGVAVSKVIHAVQQADPSFFLPLAGVGFSIARYYSWTLMNKCITNEEIAMCVVARPQVQKILWP